MDGWNKFKNLLNHKTDPQIYTNQVVKEPIASQPTKSQDTPAPHRHPKVTMANRRRCPTNAHRYPAPGVPGNANQNETSPKALLLPVDRLQSGTNSKALSNSLAGYRLPDKNPFSKSPFHACQMKQSPSIQRTGSLCSRFRNRHNNLHVGFLF